MPLIRRGSSTRLVGWPIYFGFALIVVTFDTSTFLHFRRRILDRINDVSVTGAATQVPLDRVGDLVTGRLGVALEQLHPGEDHARGAVTALQAVTLPEPFLHRVQRA